MSDNFNPGVVLGVMHFVAWMPVIWFVLKWGWTKQGDIANIAIALCLKILLSDYVVDALRDVLR